MYVCNYACMYVCMYVCTYMCTQTFDICSNLYIHIIKREREREIELHPYTLYIYTHIHKDIHSLFHDSGEVLKRVTSRVLPLCLEDLEGTAGNPDTLGS